MYNKTYPSKQALNAHRKTKGHKSWEEASELRKLTTRDNTILIKRLDIEKSV